MARSGARRAAQRGVAAVAVEKFSKNPDYGNDGGQRSPNNRSEPRTLDDLLAPAKGYRTGKVLAHGVGPDATVPDYTLLQADLTAADSNSRSN